MSADFIKQIEDGFTALGHHDHSMSRSRPYSGQPWTDNGLRGQTEVRGLTMRDIRDCFFRAIFLSASHVVPHLYEEADKGEAACLSPADLYGWDLNALSPEAIAQNLSCEIERMMGIFPNLAGCPTTDEIMACLDAGDMNCVSLTASPAQARDGSRTIPPKDNLNAE